MKYSKLSLVEFIYRQNFYIHLFDTLKYYILILIPNILINNDLRKSLFIRIQNTIVYSFKNTKLYYNKYMIGLSLYKKLMKMDYNERSFYILKNIPVYCILDNTHNKLKNISESFTSNVYPPLKNMNINLKDIDKEFMKKIVIYVENYIHLSFHAYSDIFFHAVLESNLSDSCDAKKLVLKFGQCMDDINFGADSIAHANDNGLVTSLFGITNSWTTMKYEFLPNLFYYLEYYNDSHLKIFNTIHNLSKKITDNVYNESKFRQSNLLQIIKDKFIRYNIKFDENKLILKSLLQTYFYTQILHSHFHNQIHSVSSAILEDKTFTYSSIQQPFNILPVKINILTETLPHKQKIFDDIYNDFIQELTNIRNSVDPEIQFLYDVDNMSWNTSS